MSILCAGSSFEHIFESILPLFDWCSVDSLIQTSKQLVNIIISRLLVQYIKHTISRSHLLILKGIVANMPSLLNISYCYNFVGLIGIGAKNPNGSESTINFKFIYKALHIDLFNNNSLGLMKLPFSTFKQMYFNITSQYYDDNGNGGNSIPTTCNIKPWSTHLNLFMNNRTHFIQLLNSINIDHYNIHWFSLLLSQITNYNFILLSTINLTDLNEFNRLKLILSEPIYAQCTHMLSADSISILANKIKMHTNLFYSIMYKNAFYKQNNDSKKLVQWYSQYIIQAALLLKIFISKFQDENDAYIYISEHFLEDEAPPLEDEAPPLEMSKKNNLLYISLLLLNITNSEFKYNVVKSAAYFSGYNPDTYNYNRSEKNIEYYLKKHLMIDDLYSSVSTIIIALIQSLIINEFEHDKENMSIILRNKEIQNSFYDYSIFHIYYGTVFNELLPINYKIRTSHNKCYNGFTKLISRRTNVTIGTDIATILGAAILGADTAAILGTNKLHDLDLISSYLLFVWKSIRNTKTVKIKYASSIFDWFLQNCKFNLFMAGNMFADYNDIITCSLDKPMKTNYNLIYSIINNNYNNNIVENFKLIMPFLKKYIVFDDHHISLLLDRIITLHNNNKQSQIDFIKIFKSDLTEIAGAFSKSKKKILSQYIL